MTTNRRPVARMNAFLDATGYAKRTLVHREIYLSDARKTEPAKMRTILRYRIHKAD
ncbi:MAG: GyrI-like domain-containing protein [Candidatus Moduliflexus flocculans]|nr:GyrI-like domain-containing protein [Candidatus Moduliflexus flocculans]